MDKCAICIRTISEGQHLHARTQTGEGCCKDCWDWLKSHFNGDRE